MIESTLSNIFAAFALIISLFSIWLTAKVRKDMQTQNLFSGFSQANQATIDHPAILKDVHGLKVSYNECRNIAYLSILMDAFQHENSNYQQTTFLDKITSIPENEKRWAKMKEIYYGEFDSKFIQKIDRQFEKNCN